MPGDGNAPPPAGDKESSSTTGEKGPLPKTIDAEPTPSATGDKKPPPETADVELTPPARDERPPPAVNRAPIPADALLAKANNRLLPKTADEGPVAIAADRAPKSAEEIAYARVDFFC